MIKELNHILKLNTFFILINFKDVIVLISPYYVPYRVGDEFESRPHAASCVITKDMNFYALAQNRPSSQLGLSDKFRAIKESVELSSEMK